jgi:polyhydroxyalkanoate synthase subunit PhaE
VVSEDKPASSQNAGFDALQGMADLWRRSGQSFFAAQQKFLTDVSEQIKAAGQSASPLTFTAFKNEAERLATSSRALFDAWTSATQLSTASDAASRRQDGNRAAGQLLGRIFDPSLWLSATGGMDQGLDRLAEGPRLADVFDTERRFLAVFQAWLSVRGRGYEHNSLMLQAWTRAITEFSKALNQKAEKNEKLESSRELLTLWVEVANTVLLETQRSDAYLESQSKLLRASTDLRLAQQDVAEFYSEMFAVPTRTEIDDVHKSVTELRRELRALKRSGKAGVLHKGNFKGREAKQ